MYAFLLTFISGISTLIGYLFIYIKKDRVGVISKSFAFATGVMITISIIELIPNSYKLLINNNDKLNTIFIVLISFITGIIIYNIINQKIEKKLTESLKLYKIGIITMITIILHNIPEGIITFLTASNNIKIGISITMAIALHNIPEGISISIPIYYSTNNKLKAFIYTLISSISESIGAIIAIIFINIITNNLLGIIYSITAGIMISVSINELYSESLKYNSKYSLKYLILGIITMYISHILI